MSHHTSINTSYIFHFILLHFYNDIGLHIHCVIVRPYLNNTDYIVGIDAFIYH